ncbi:hypothetical protein LX32DRAFT_691517 [Colletotrichum zoysiae]|uniref:Uncharacterized protein n=1 Tax=Colletotrichum zoysiae TaxID=1216348 RepID=A0AAD9HP30_9PEZI|nr:hypothetical protein LX32DRAFT_691517 [Colletotrichum zoysiae]
MHEDLAAVIAGTSAEVRDLIQQQSIIANNHNHNHNNNNSRNSNQKLLGTLYAELRGVHDDMESSYRRLKLCSRSAYLSKAASSRLTLRVRPGLLFLERAFRLGDIHKGMEGIMAQLQNSLEKERIPALDNAVLDALAKVMPTKPDAFAMLLGGSSAVDAAEKNER